MRVLFLLLMFLCDILLFAVDRNCCCVILPFADAVCDLLLAAAGADTVY